MRKSAWAGVAASSANPSSASATARIPRGEGSECSADEDDADVIDVGAGRSGGDEVAQALEEFCRIVVVESRPRVEPKRLGALQRRLVDDGARRVGGRAGAPVGAVGVGGKRRDAGRARER